MLHMNEDVEGKFNLRSFSRRTFPMKPVPPVMKTTYEKNQRQVLFHRSMIFEN